MKSSHIHGLLERSTDSYPDRPAVADGNTVLTYAELDQQANKIAHLLSEVGVRPGDLVGVFVEKSALAVTALYGVMKAGAAYVPLDPKAPPARLAKVAADADLTALLTARSRLPRVRLLLGDLADVTIVVALDTDAPDDLGSHLAGAGDLARQPSHRANLRVAESDLAYVIYTSGSTGNPKGVALSHANASAFVNWAVEALDLGPADRLSSHAPFHFDLSIFDLYASAAAGACVHLVPSTVSVFPVDLACFIEEHALTVWYSVPTVLNSLAEHGQLESRTFDSLRAVVFAGEVFPTPALRRLMEVLPNPDYWNWYGPTETNVCTAYKVPSVPTSNDDIPIGQAIANTEAVIVDNSGRPVEDGGIGELLISGPTVTRGYWNDDKRTADAIVASPTRPEKMAYRTGDLVARDSKNNLIFVGRIDNQIKIRGHRVDLGDIETIIHACPGVVGAAVVALADPEISSTLHAFVVLDESTSTTNVQHHCKKLLPTYMIPAGITAMEALPRTANLKIDRDALIDQAAIRNARRYERHPKDHAQVTAADRTPHRPSRPSSG